MEISPLDIPDEMLQNCSSNDYVFEILERVLQMNED